MCQKWVRCLSSCDPLFFIVPTMEYILSAWFECAAGPRTTVSFLQL